jgi:hypothetical protein
MTLNNIIEYGEKNKLRLYVSTTILCNRMTEMKENNLFE